MDKEWQGCHQRTKEWGRKISFAKKLSWVEPVDLESPWKIRHWMEKHVENPRVGQSLPPCNQVIETPTLRPLSVRDQAEDQKFNSQEKSRIYESTASQRVRGNVGQKRGLIESLLWKMTRQWPPALSPPCPACKTALGLECSSVLHRSKSCFFKWTCQYSYMSFLLVNCIMYFFSLLNPYCLCVVDVSPVYRIWLKCVLWLLSSLIISSLTGTFRTLNPLVLYLVEGTPFELSRVSFSLIPVWAPPFWHSHMFQAHFVLCLPSPEINLLSQQFLVAFCGEWYMEKKI